MPSKQWLIKPTAPPDHLARYADMSRTLAQVLYNRGYEDPDAAARFLGGKAEAHSPFALTGMSRALARISRAIRKQERMIVYGDFDADGVTSTALLVTALESLGAVVRPYIPHRVDEGYGLNSEALLRLRRRGVNLVITVDCGIRSIQEVEDGKAYGLDIIVTDHHSLGPDLPDAYAVINPKQEDPTHPDHMLAGVGVAYRLAEALFKSMAENHRVTSPLSLDELVDLVAIGTVADLAPLNRLENRALVLRGLQKLNRADRLGVRALLNVAGTQPGSVNAMSIGFALGPRINAAGRLDSAMHAYDLLRATDENEATRLAQELQALNVKRQELTRAAQATIRESLGEDLENDLPLIIASNPGFLPGIVGLVAGRLVEEFYRPAIVMETGETESRASCRSIPQFDITRALDQCADLLVRHGGHAQAAGFTILNENLPAFRERMMAITRQALRGQDLSPILDVDAEIDPRQLDFPLASELARLEPTGHANGSPVFVSRGLAVQEFRRVGATGDHLKLRLMRSRAAPLDAIGFNLGAWTENLPDCVDVAYRLEINEFNGKSTVQLNLQDLRPARLT